MAVLCHEVDGVLFLFLKSRIPQVRLLSANSPGNVDAAENDDVCTEINISVTAVICYPNYAEPKLTRTSVTQVCWQMAAVETENSTKNTLLRTEERSEKFYDLFCYLETTVEPISMNPAEPLAD